MKPELEQVLIVSNVDENGTVTMIRKNEHGDQVIYHAKPMSADEISRFLSGQMHMSEGYTGPGERKQWMENGHEAL